MQAEITLDDVKYYPFPGYNVCLFPKYRKVASGILVSIEDTLMADFKICKEMRKSEDKSDVIKLDAWKENFACTLEEFRLATECQRVKKSPGEHNIQVHVEALKYMSEIYESKNTLLCAFNRIWETGLVIAQWKRTVVIPILKKNKDPKQLSCYRPLSLTCIL
ncbi:hypothetical protein CEXT_453751 [Caerostris extrusa]|uniref:Uncharacterized protein n=1 Tax=Caerostris extrusa TaxID=172846 RepID=A0AAV4THV7_CAEEX|nr:hypothetical protein CEXT_453751 [Caerostris extrusa]